MANSSSFQGSLSNSFKCLFSYTQQFHRLLEALCSFLLSSLDRCQSLIHNTVRREYCPLSSTHLQTGTSTFHLPSFPHPPSLAASIMPSSLIYINVMKRLKTQPCLYQAIFLPSCHYDAARGGYTHGLGFLAHQSSARYSMAFALITHNMLS